MSRIRYIKPGFFTDDDLGECQPLARLLFAGLWCIADREGRLEDRPKRIKVEVLPYDECDVNALLDELQAHGRLIVRYEIQGKRYVAIPGWTNHQKPHTRELPSTIPAPAEHDLGSAEASPRQCPSTPEAMPSPASRAHVMGMGMGNGDGEGNTLCPNSDESAPTPVTKPGKVKAPDWQAKADFYLAESHFPSDLMQLAELMACENKTGKVSLSRVVNELYEPLVALQSEVSDDALRHGLRAAITAMAPNANYVRKAAAKYRPGAGAVPVATRSHGYDDLLETS